MAESLNIKITATDSTAAAFASLNRNMNNVSGSFQRLSSTISGFTRGAVGAVLAGSIGEAIGSVVRYADTWTLMQNRLRSAGLTANETATAQTKIAEIASRSRSDLSETANLYARVAFATETMGVKQSDVAKVTETLSMAFKMSGKTALEAQSAVTQFTQALSSGVLQGDELRSLRENAPEVARAIATAFGTTVGGLKALGAEGQLTSDRIFQAILDAAPQIEARFATTESTVSDIWTRITNAIQKSIGAIQDMFKESPQVTAALEAQIAAQKELEKQINSTKEAQDKLSQAELASAIKAEETNFANLTKSIENTEIAAKKVFAALQNDIGPKYVQQFQIDPESYKSALDLLQKMLNGTAQEANAASSELAKLEQGDEFLANLIFNTSKLAREMVGLTINAEKAKQKIDELKNVGPQQQVMEVANKALASYGIPEEVLNRRKFATDEYVTNRYREISADKLARYTQEELSKSRGLLSQEQAAGIAKTRIEKELETEATNKAMQAGRKHQDEIENLIQKYREAADPLLKYREDLAIVEEAYRKGEISGATYAETVANIKKAMEKAAEGTDPLKKQTEELTRAFESFGRKSADAIADFAVEGKISFSDLIRSFTKELISFAVYQNLFKSIFGGTGVNLLSFLTPSRSTIPGGATGGLRASGGSVSSGSSYIVGERGPELFMPNRSGSIIPNGIGGGGNVNVNVINNSNSQATTRETVDGRGNRNIDIIIGDVVAKEIGRIGSSVNQSLRNTFQTSPALVGR